MLEFSYQKVHTAKFQVPSLSNREARQELMNTALSDKQQQCRPWPGIGVLRDIHILEHAECL